MRSIVFLLFISILVYSCKQENKEAETPKADTELEELYALMQGSFNSQKQAEADSSYYNISLHMYPIWEDKGMYLYVEQAMNSRQDAPYRQRVYQVTRLNDSVLSSAVYTFPNDSLWIGKWKNPKAFDSISPVQITEREGCAVLLKKTGENIFEGATDDKSCSSNLRGASFATSKVKITDKGIESWDQGFDSDGNQVWGATEGGYIFDKIQK